MIIKAPKQVHFTFDGEKEVSTVFLSELKRYETMLFDAETNLWERPKVSFTEEKAKEYHIEAVKEELGDFIYQDVSGLFESLE